MAKKHPAEIELARLRSLLQPPLMHFPAVDTKKLLAESTEKSKMGNPIARAWFLLPELGAVQERDFNPQRIVSTGQRLKDAGPAYGDEITATIALRNALATLYADKLAALDEKIASSFGLGEMLTSQHAMSAEPLKPMTVTEGGHVSEEPPAAGTKVVAGIDIAASRAEGMEPAVTTKVAKRTPKQARVAEEKAAAKPAAKKGDKFVARGVKAPSKESVKAKADKIEKAADAKKKAKK